MNEVIIINVSRQDVKELQEISTQSFLQAYSEQNDTDNMESYIQQSFSIDKLRGELANENSRFYFAVLDDSVIAYLKLNCGPSQTELKDQNSLEIERIYVLKEFYGRRVAALLLEKALQVAIELNVDFLWLGVWEKNGRAINFYTKNGFVEFDKHIFKLGSEEQIDILMKRPMHPI